MKASKADFAILGGDFNIDPRLILLLLLLFIILLFSLFSINNSKNYSYYYNFYNYYGVGRDSRGCRESQRPVVYAIITLPIIIKITLRAPYH